MPVLDADITKWLKNSPPQTRREVEAVLRDLMDRWSLPSEAVALKDPEAARIYLTRLRWPNDRVTCPYCGSASITPYSVATDTYSCRDCESPRWNVRTGTAFYRSNLLLSQWLQCLRIYLDCDPQTFVAVRYADARVVARRTAYLIADRIEDACGDLIGSRSPLWAAVLPMLATGAAVEDETNEENAA